ncbi:hypothetical protein HY641_04910 [Candidatus Woesearchaeota archaeon]|nr:hypothetical protein [Candidatus Woesearchaeota archaeon]
MSTSNLVRRSQISWAIILTIFFLILFAMLLYLLSSYMQAGADLSLIRGQLSETELVPLKEHIQDCLDLASRKGLILAGKHGGVIYTSQGGPTPDPPPTSLGEDYLLYEGDIIPYAVVPFRGTLGGGSFRYAAEPPEYPWDGFPEYQPPCDTTCPPPTTSTKGLSGYNLLTSLPKLFTVSMQDQLERYIHNTTLTCIDWNQFTTLATSAGNSSLHVIITHASTIISFEYPLVITNTITGAQGRIRDFLIEYPVRLGQMINFTSDTLDDEVSTLEFNLNASTVETLTFERRDHIHNLDYIIITSDPQSTILETPYELRFAIRNRRPALFLLNDSRHRTLNTFVICGGKDSNQNYDPPIIFLTQNQAQLCIQNGNGCNPSSTCAILNAIDPDDNPLTYTYQLDTPEPTNATTIVSEATLILLQATNQRLGIMVNVTDGQHADSQTLRFRTTRIP